MPELAEVEFYRKEWDPGLGQKITRVHLNPKARIFRDTDAAVIRRELKGRSLLASYAHGKNLLFQISDGCWLAGHLGMSGNLHAEIPDYRPEKHDHLILFGENAALVFTDPRMFGRVRFDRTEDENEFPEWWQTLPPEILSKAFTKKHLTAFLTCHPKIPIKTLLLNQDGFPGIGNWMADEICWRLPIRPAALGGNFLEGRSPCRPELLWKALRQVSRQAMRVIGDGWKTPPDSWLFNHRWKDGGRCPRKDCRSSLIRAELRGRRTCWCPRCQPEE